MSERVREYREAMERKYGSLHWDIKCTQEEFDEFIRLCKLKEEAEDLEAV